MSYNIEYTAVFADLIILFDDKFEMCVSYETLDCVIDMAKKEMEYYKFKTASIIEKEPERKLISITLS